MEDIPTIAVASLTLRTLALTDDNHSGSSGWPSSFNLDTNVSQPPRITMINKFEILHNCGETL